MNNKELQILILKGNAATTIESKLVVIVTPDIKVFQSFENCARYIDLITLIAQLNLMIENLFEFLKTNTQLSEDKIDFHIRDIQAKIKNNEVEV